MITLEKTILLMMDAKKLDLNIVVKQSDISVFNVVQKSPRQIVDVVKKDVVTVFVPIIVIFIYYQNVIFVLFVKVYIQENIPVIIVRVVNVVMS